MRRALNKLLSVDSQFHALGCRESAIYQGWHGVTQRRCDFSGRVLVQLGGLSGDDRRPQIQVWHI